MGNAFRSWDDESNYHPVDCCQNSKATYRCQYKLSQRIYYHNSINIKNLDDIEEPLRDLLIKLIPYWKGSSSFTIQWIGCEKCMKEELKKHFAQPRRMERTS